jgi:hypothetical protein
MYEIYGTVKCVCCAKWKKYKLVGISAFWNVCFKKEDSQWLLVTLLSFIYKCVVIGITGVSLEGLNYCCSQVGSVQNNNIHSNIVLVVARYNSCEACTAGRNHSIRSRPHTHAHPENPSFSVYLMVWLQIDRTVSFYMSLFSWVI